MESALDPAIGTCLLDVPTEDQLLSRPFQDFSSTLKPFRVTDDPHTSITVSVNCLQGDTIVRESGPADRTTAFSTRQTGSWKSPAPPSICDQLQSLKVTEIWLFFYRNCEYKNLRIQSQKCIMCFGKRKDIIHITKKSPEWNPLISCIHILEFDNVVWKEYILGTILRT